MLLHVALVIDAVYSSRSRTAASDMYTGYLSNSRTCSDSLWYRYTDINETAMHPCACRRDNKAAKAEDGGRIRLITRCDRVGDTKCGSDQRWGIGPGYQPRNSPRSLHQERWRDMLDMQCDPTPLAVGRSYHRVVADCEGHIVSAVSGLTTSSYRSSEHRYTFPQ